MTTASPTSRTMPFGASTPRIAMVMLLVAACAAPAQSRRAYPGPLTERVLVMALATPDTAWHNGPSAVSVELERKIREALTGKLPPARWWLVSHRDVDATLMTEGPYPSSATDLRDLAKLTRARVAIGVLAARRGDSVVVHGTRVVGGIADTMPTVVAPSVDEAARRLALALRETLATRGSP